MGLAHIKNFHNLATTTKRYINEKQNDLLFL